MPQSGQLVFSSGCVRLLLLISIKWGASAWPLIMLRKNRNWVYNNIENLIWNSAELFFLPCWKFLIIMMALAWRLNSTFSAKHVGCCTSSTITSHPGLAATCVIAPNWTLYMLSKYLKYILCVQFKCQKQASYGITTTGLTYFSPRIIKSLTHPWKRGRRKGPWWCWWVELVSVQRIFLHLV